MVSTFDNTGHLDVLALLRGTENLLMDLIYDEEIVKQGLKKIIAAWAEVNDELYEIVKETNDGGATVGWLPIWGPGKLAQLQCDISVMLSPEMFAKYVVPELEECISKLDYCFYHLDGQAQIRHLDHLLAIEGLNMISKTLQVKNSLSKCSRIKSCRQ